MRSLLIALLLAPLALPAQSFDCKLAQSPREKAVCADTRLSALDSEIAAGYKSLRAQLSPTSAALVQSDQREWLHWIDLVCPASGNAVESNQTRCLQNQYFTRAHDLEHATRIGSTLIFPRTHFLFKSNPAIGNNASPVNPGIGYGSLRWPQIDRPNTAQSAFNDAAKARAAKLAVGIDPEHKNSTFTTAVDTQGVIDAYYTIAAANDRLIAVTFTDGYYSWGAAHPVTGSSSFLWWLDRNRELTTTDVFLPNSAWQQKLVPLAIAGLQSNPDIKDMLWKGDGLKNPVQQAVPDPRNWTPTRDGLAITFGQYAVGPYVIGMPQAHLRWNDLKSLLAPTLQPATLPAPITKPNP